MITCHVLKNYLPDHIAGIEVYVSNICASNTESNIVLIEGDKSSVYRHDNTSVIIATESDLRKKDFVKKIVVDFKIGIFHYHQFENGYTITDLFLNELKSLGCELHFTFHLVQYFCSNLMFIKDITEQCSINPNIRDCSRCVFKTSHLQKLPDFLRKNDIFFNLKIIPRLNRAIKSSILNAENTINNLDRIQKAFDVIFTLNKHFFYKMKLSFPSKEIRFIERYLPEITKKNKLIKGKLKCVFVGRIEHSKGIDRLFNLADKLNDSNIQIDIFGQAYNKMYLDTLISNYSSETNIRYQGLIRPEDINSTLSQYDIFIHPSRIAEMTPLVLFESLSNNVPVLANDIFGLNTYIKDGINGWLVNFEDIAGVANRISEINSKWK